MQSLYTAGIKLYGLAIALAAAFNPKARLWVEGRKKVKSHTGLKGISGCIWIHCASLGEFEQGRPVLEELKKRHPHKSILLTFFSPSGYEVRKDYKLADHVAYLPLDTPLRVNEFLNAYAPSIAIFVKYEIWHNLLSALRSRGIPTILISALFRNDQVYFKPWGKWFRKELKGMSRIFTQDAESVIRLNQIGISNAIHAGDTRFDRVHEIAQSTSKEGALATYGLDKVLIIAGSTWEPDESLLIKFFQKYHSQFPYLRLVLVPHEISETHIQAMKARVPQAALWTDCKTENCMQPILIVNTIGLLSEMYKQAHIAYVGGGFGAGIHNILEPAAFGVPIVFGPRNDKFKEARDLLKLGGAFEIDGYDTLEHIFLRLLEDTQSYDKAASTSSTYVNKGIGATEKICNYLDSLVGTE